MQLNRAQSTMMRLNTNLRSLVIEYPRLDENQDVLAALVHAHQQDVRFNLPVVRANENGISVKLPALLSGMFQLSIQDGKKSFSHRIALQ